MSRINSFPKIHHVGSDYIPNLFKGVVEITEKIDGSQFSFGCTTEGEIVFRSKGKEMFFESYEKMFKLAVDFVIDKQEFLLNNPGVFFYGEFLSKPHHNILNYEKTPVNNIFLFGVYIKGSGFVNDYQTLQNWGNKLDLSVVPLLYCGEVNSFEELLKYLTTPSILGNTEVEGIVIKNYKELIAVGGGIQPVFAKYVRESFKERHQKEWTSSKDKLQEFIDSFRTEARWQKAIQHLKEQGELVNEPKDIGKLIFEIERDLLEEEIENIKIGLFRLFKDQIGRKAKSGFPEWYKSHLSKSIFE